MSAQHNFFATVPRNMELLLQQELEEMGAVEVRQTVAGVYFSGPLEIGYRAVLWSRLANTVLLPLTGFPARTPEELYKGVRGIAWDEHFRVDQTFAVTFNSARSEITHTKYGALKVKDAVVDQFRDAFDQRPSVDLDRPDVRINCHIDQDYATISIDLAGESLHRRSYREDWGKAPLKENVAAAVLLRAGWPDIYAEGGPLFDPMCGSGTLLIEGALMAGDHAPGLLRDYFGFTGWRRHDEGIWTDLLEEAEERRRVGMSKIPLIVGSDKSRRAVETAEKNIAAAGLEDHITVERRAVVDIEPPFAAERPGLVVVNAPYGERMGGEGEAEVVHRELGEVLKARFPGWKATVLTGSKELGQELRLRADKRYTLYNGRLECTLLNFELRKNFKQ
ncbi:MAG: THUMP domain-containing protein [Bradymonadaceae bacterium]